MTVLNDMFLYLRRPSFIARREAFTPDSLMVIFKLLGLSFLMLPLTGLLLGTVFAVTGVSLPEPSDAFQNMAKQSNFILLAAVAAPLIEEGLFRSWLGNRWGILLIAPGLLAVAVIWTLLGREDISSGLRLVAGSAVMSSFALYLARYWRLRSEPGVLDRALRRVFPYAFWATSLAFGAMHLANYESGEMGLLLPLLVLPQFIVGVIIGYVRMRFGLLAAIGFHSGYNTILLTIFTILAEAPL